LFIAEQNIYSNETNDSVVLSEQTHTEHHEATIKNNNIIDIIDIDELKAEISRRSGQRKCDAEGKLKRDAANLDKYFETEFYDRKLDTYEKEIYYNSMAGISEMLTFSQLPGKFRTVPVRDTIFILIWCPYE
jgi:hypothetical protein